MTATILRGLAVAIAVLALVDPSLTSRRHERPLVVVDAADPERDADLLRRARQALERDFEVLSDPFAGADAVVAVGDRLPRAAIGARYVAAVQPDPPASGVSLELVEAPSRVAAQSAVPVRVRARAADGQRVIISVATGEAVQATAVASSSGGVVDTTLAVVPAIGGAALVEASVTAGGGDTARAARVVSIDAEPWRVLFHDPRPAWGATFVRRVIEQDGRFAVSSRIQTSRGVASSAGGPPPDLADARRLADYDVIVVGAPDALTERDIAGLHAYLRRRGGSVVLLLDSESRGYVDQLVRATGWQHARLSAAAAIVPDAGLPLRAGSIAWPRGLPPAARALAIADTTGGERGRVAIWEAPVGAGRVVVSGALDAWHFRDPSQSGFESFWRNVLAELSVASPRAIAVRPTQSVLVPGDTTSVDVVLRDMQLAPRTDGQALTAQVTAWATSGADSIPVAFWPTSEPGVLRTTFRAPPREGMWRIAVTDGTNSSDAFVAVDHRFVTPGRAEPALVAAIAAAHGGSVLPASRLRELPSLLRAALDPAPRLVQWNPMRSPWWIVPFALLLGYEWWWRRRRGLA